MASKSKSNSKSKTTTTAKKKTSSGKNANSIKLKTATTKTTTAKKTSSTQPKNKKVVTSAAAKKKTSPAKKKVSQTKKKQTQTPKIVDIVKVEKDVNKESVDTNTKKLKKVEVKVTKEKDKKNNFFKNILDKIKGLSNVGILNKFKKLSLSIKILVVVGIICFLVLLVEGILFVVHINDVDSKTVYNDAYNDITYDSGDFLAVGASDFRYSKINSKNGNVRGKLIKYTENGSVVFEKIYKRGISTTFNSIITVNDGYIVVGTGIFSKDEQENDGKEAVIIKYDKDGEIVWEKFYQVLTNTGFNKVIATSDGYIAVGQSIYANLELGNHTTGGGIIVKYDKDGNEIWHANHGGNKSGNFNDVVQIGSDFYVVGKDGSDSGNIVKFNAKGEYQWHKNYSYTDSFGFSGIVNLNDELYVVGSKKILPEGTNDESNRSTYNTDALLVKYDLNGEILFEKTFGGSSYEKYNDIIAYHNNLYVVGHLCSRDAGLKVITQEKDQMTGFIIRYDYNGNILRKEAFGGSKNDNLNALTTDGVSLYAVGYSNSKDGNLRTSNSNGKDYFGKIIKLNSKFKSFFIK